jgi:hypothetical protein
LFLAALLAASGALSSPRPCAARTVTELVDIIQTTDPPHQPPARLAQHARRWDKKKYDLWAEYRLAARKELSRKDEEAAEALAGLIRRTKDHTIKLTALTALSEMPNPTDLKPTAPLMIQLLGSDNVGLRYLAAKVLGQMQHVPAVSALAKLADSEKEIMRLAVADALGEIGSPSGIQALLTLLRDTAKPVRLHATDALGKTWYVLDVVPALVEQLRKDDVNERNAAVEAIDRLLGYNIAADPSWLIAHSAEQREKIIKAFLDWWNAALKKSSDLVRPIRAKPELTFRLSLAVDKDQGKPIRMTALQFIEKESDPASVRVLIRVMLDRDKAIRRRGARVASKISELRIEYVGNESEGQWYEKVDEFRRRWAERRG